MKAYIYTQQISDGMLDFLHGASYGIKELYVPEYKIYANLGGNQGQMMIFSDDKTRFEGAASATEIDLDEGIVSDLQTAIDTKIRLKPKLRKLLNG